MFQAQRHLGARAMSPNNTLFSFSLCFLCSIFISCEGRLAISSCRLPSRLATLMERESFPFPVVPASLRK